MIKRTEQSRHDAVSSSDLLGKQLKHHVVAFSTGLLATECIPTAYSMLVRYRVDAGEMLCVTSQDAGQQESSAMCCVSLKQHLQSDTIPAASQDEHMLCCRSPTPVAGQKGPSACRNRFPRPQSSAA
jgi:hypothetical protein